MKLGKNQFLLTEKECITCEYHKHIIMGSYNIFLGQDTNYKIVKSVFGNVVLIGYALDAVYPEYTEEQMCNNLMNAIARGECGPDYTQTWGGRWVVAVTMESFDLTIWHDACGLKQTFYTFAKDGNVRWMIASQARYLAFECGYKTDPIAEIYLKTAQDKCEEFSWPLNATIYSEVKRLLPNHYLNCLRKTVERIVMHPHHYNSNIDEVVVSCAKLLKNQMKAAATRFHLAITLTAGLDSRIVFAACVSQQLMIDAVTLQFPKMESNHEDLLIPVKLCEKYHYDHKILKCTNEKCEFDDIYCSHAENPHEYWSSMEACRTKHGYHTSLWVKGSCNEIARSSFGRLHNSQINAESLCYLYGIPALPFAINTIQKWLDSLRQQDTLKIIDILDQFYWEHRMGSWLAECLNEADVAGETMTPFNVRVLLMQVLSVPYRYRIPSNYTLFSKLLAALQPDIGELPINASRCNSVLAEFGRFVKYRCPGIYRLKLSLGISRKKIHYRSNSSRYC